MFLQNALERRPIIFVPKLCMVGWWWWWYYSNMHHIRWNLSYLRLTHPPRIIFPTTIMKIRKDIFGWVCAILGQLLLCYVSETLMKYKIFWWWRSKPTPSFLSIFDSANTRIYYSSRRKKFKKRKKKKAYSLIWHLLMFN